MGAIEGPAAMGEKHLSNRIARLALSLLLFCPANAWAQASNSAVPPDTAVISPGGVDMVSGQYRDTTRDLAVGPDGTGGLALDRISRGPKLFRTTGTSTLKGRCSG
jgi:hypothetical protein